MNILTRIRSFMLAEFIIAKLEAQAAHVRAELLSRQLRQRSDSMGRAVCRMHFDAAERVRLENENAMMRASLRSIAAGVEDPREVAVRVIAETVDGSGEVRA